MAKGIMYVRKNVSQDPVRLTSLCTAVYMCVAMLLMP